jgi:hypothetical protein
LNSPFEFHPDFIQNIFLGLSELLTLQDPSKNRHSINPQSLLDTTALKTNQIKCRNFSAGMKICKLPNESNVDMMTLERPHILNEISSMIEARNVYLARLQSMMISQGTPRSFTSNIPQELIPYLHMNYVNEYQGQDNPSLPIDLYKISMFNQSNDFSNLGRSISNPLLRIRQNTTVTPFLETELKNNIHRRTIRSTEALPLQSWESFRYPCNRLNIAEGVQLSQRLDTVINSQGNFESFPMKLHRLLNEVEKNPEQECIIRFLPNGESFEFVNISQFETKLMKVYFPRMKSFASFQRQLNLYKFRRVTNSQGVYFHPYFHRDYPLSCCRMKRYNAKRLICERNKG